MSLYTESYQTKSINLKIEITDILNFYLDIFKAFSICAIY